MLLAIKRCTSLLKMGSRFKILLSKLKKNDFSDLGSKFEIKQNMVKKVKKGKPKWIEKKKIL
jgi:hypothetical protein